MSIKEQHYPYRIANNQNYRGNHNSSDLIIYQLQNEINYLKNEINKINVKIEKDECQDDKLYQSIIEYVDNKCDNCNMDRILTGNGVPNDNLGNNGNFYLDNSTGNYYIKIAGRWILRGNLQGPPGSQILTGNGVPNNALGNIGDFYLDNVSKIYYTKIDSGDGTGIWVAQGSLAASYNIPITLPISFTSSVPVPSTPQSFLTSENQIAIVANGLATFTQWQSGGISFPTNTMYVYYAPTGFTFPASTYMNVTYTNIDPLPAGQVILVELYFNIAGINPPNIYTNVLFGNTYGYGFQYPQGAPANTSKSVALQIYNFQTDSPLFLSPSSSFIITLTGLSGTNGLINSTVQINISG